MAESTLANNTAGQTAAMAFEKRIAGMLPRNQLKTRLILLLLCFMYLLYFATSTFVGLSAGEVVLERYFISLNEIPTSSQPSTPSAEPTTPIERIPRIIHQIYKNDTVPEKWLQAHQSCLEKTPSGNWTHFLWTDDKARNFLRNFYSWFLPLYDSYPYNVQRIDALRYLLLYHFGGIYLDLDVGCKKDLSPLLKHRAFFGKTSPYGVSNDVMGAEKGHDLFRSLVLSLEGTNHYRGTKYPTVMLSTGPMFVTRVLVDFLRKESSEHHSLAVPSAGIDSPVAILPPDLYGMSPISYFEHYPGSSWHGWDVWVLAQISRRPILFISGACVTVVAIMVFIRRRRRRIVRL